MLHEEYDSLDEEEKKEIIKLLTTSANNAYGLLENLLSWSRLHLKGVEVKNQEVNLHNQIIDATSPLVQMAKDKQIEITNKVDHNFVFSTDPDLLSTIVRNLVSNSIKFTNREGHIIISNNNEGNDIEISVSDNGVGIPSEKQKNIFNSLGESTNGTNREKGTGLGLSACKEMAELMGGSIRVESEGEGKGTTFIVTLPIKKE
jgi:signal transduction histidine kinase